jgi:hypothetical protein
VRQLAVFAIALALGAGAAIALASCGGDDAELLPGTTAQEIEENLDLVAQRTEEGECVGAEDAVATVNAQVEALEDVDPKLEEALRRGATRLSEVVLDCEEATTETVAPAREADETEEPDEIPPGQEKKGEKEREKELRDLEKEEQKAEKEASPPAKKEPPEKELPEPPSEDGSTGAPGGVSPSEPVEPGDGE